MTAVVCRAVTVRGRVQGVGFRWSCAREAERLGVAGWVRNRADGAVEAELTGPPDAVDVLLDWLRTGPPGAAVAGVEVVELAASGATGGFSIR